MCGFNRLPQPFIYIPELTTQVTTSLDRTVDRRDSVLISLVLLRTESLSPREERLHLLLLGGLEVILFDPEVRTDGTLVGIL